MHVEIVFDISDSNNDVMIYVGAYFNRHEVFKTWTQYFLSVQLCPFFRLIRREMKKALTR